MQGRVAAIAAVLMSLAVLPGANAVPFSGRIGRKALKPGTYRAAFAARDAAGNSSTKTPSVGFKVVKR